MTERVVAAALRRGATSWWARTAAQSLAVGLLGGCGVAVAGEHGGLAMPSIPEVGLAGVALALAWQVVAMVRRVIEMRWGRPARHAVEYSAAGGGGGRRGGKPGDDEPSLRQLAAQLADLHRAYVDPQGGPASTSVEALAAIRSMSAEQRRQGAALDRLVEAIGGLQRAIADLQRTVDRLAARVGAD